jgi:hypothetical protein
VSVDLVASVATTNVGNLSSADETNLSDGRVAAGGDVAFAAATHSIKESVDKNMAKPPPAPDAPAAAVAAADQPSLFDVSLAAEETKSASVLPFEDVEPQISYNSISSVGDIVLFFQVRASQGGNADSSTYMAFHDGCSKNHYLDLNCVEALRKQRGEGKDLPKYYIGVVIFSENMAASATQNPFNLAEGTEFTVITAKPIQSVYPRGFGRGCRHAAVAAGATDSSIKITFRSILPGDTVLCLPTRDKSSQSRGGGGVKADGEGSSSTIGSAAISRPDVTYIAFSDSTNAPLYTASPESIAAFKRKNRVNHLTFLLGKVVMVSKIQEEEEQEQEEEGDEGETKKTKTGAAPTMKERIDARRRSSKKGDDLSAKNKSSGKKRSSARPSKERFLLTLAPL